MGLESLNKFSLNYIFFLHIKSKYTLCVSIKMAHLLLRYHSSIILNLYFILNTSIKYIVK